MNPIFKTGTNDNETFIPGGGENFIDGNGGTDRIDYSAVNQNIRVALQDTGASSVYIGGLARDLVKNIEDITGGSGDDHITGNAGTNKLRGGPGRDVLDGREGLDFAEYAEKTDSVHVKIAQNGESIVFVNGVPEDTLRNIENIIGGSGDDHIVGTGHYNLLFGGPGDDIIEGKGFVDALSGGAGADTYVYRTFQDSTPRHTDLVADFDRSQGDKFDLSMMDANINKSGQQTLTFSGETAQAHSLWYHCGNYTPFQGNNSGGYYTLHLYADVNGDRDADLAITVYSPASDFIATDFIL